MKKEHIITNLSSLCNNCGFFTSNTIVNNGYGCMHPENEDPGIIVKINGKEYHPNFSSYRDDEDIIISKSFTKRNIKCNRRLAKKFWKKTKKLTADQREKILNKQGYYFRGRCFDYSCPISCTVEFENIKDYKNSSDFDYIKNKQDMPFGWGDDLMSLEVSEADRMNIDY